MRDFYKSFDKTIGILRTSLKYGCKASEEVERNLLTPTAGILPKHWTPDRQLRAALLMLATSYAPSDSTDVSTLRNQLAELNDEMEGGFYTYSESFVKTHVALVKAGHSPTQIELTEWARKGLRNDSIRHYMAMSLFILNQPSPTFEVIFASVRNFLKILGENCDPYMSAKAGPVSKPLVAGAASSKKTIVPPRCTRCWRNGHKYPDCHCYACGGDIVNHLFCPNWEKHQETGTRWVAPSLLNQKNPKSTLPSGSQSNQDGSTLECTDEAIKKARKSLHAMYTARKRQKKDD